MAKTISVGQKSTRLAKVKEYKTGDVIKLGKKEMDVIETFQSEQKELSIMLDMLMSKKRICQEKFWDTIRDLYPGLADFDLYADWKKNEIIIRSRFRKDTNYKSI